MVHSPHQRGFSEADAKGFDDLLVRVDHARLTLCVMQAALSQDALKASSHDLRSILHMQLCTLFQLRSSYETIALVVYTDEVDALTVARLSDQHSLSSSNLIVVDR